MKYELHPLCTFFPRMFGAEFDALRDDIKENGLKQPIVIYDGMILDGGNRYKACIESGVEPVFIEYDGDNIASFVLSMNMHRRHLSQGQYAAIVSSMQNWEQSHPSIKLSKDGCNVAPLSTVADRAAQSGASRRTQQMADKVAKSDPDLAKKVAHGEISLPKAIKQISPQKKTQEEDQEKEQIQQELYGDAEIDPAVEIEAAHKEIERLTQIIESDDQLSEANKEIKRLLALCDTQQLRINSLMNEKGEATRMARLYKARLEKLEKQVNQSDLVNF